MFNALELCNVFSLPLIEISDIIEAGEVLHCSFSFDITSLFQKALQFNKRNEEYDLKSLLFTSETSYKKGRFGETIIHYKNTKGEWRC